ncbi:DUF5919 domain-containing protein [Pseudonocardia spinosispora]|uniref:DUF5919 domain-containing protein n=1 Tax=Pseudonocardia spinosispora TaxID=103441 RepID=UPI0003FB1010|nr:DUF5919 domain-containing protein [Pseudonocardia spinosispora]
MEPHGTLLKQLLRHRHLQGHRAFCREYDRVARSLDRSLVGKWPGKAQFYRWLAGDLAGLPYADHCLILEKMFPGRSALELFEPSAVEPTAGAVVPSTLDLTGVFRTRAEFTQAMPPSVIFDGARRLRCCGLSLNLICQQYSDAGLRAIVEGGATVECLFLDPEGEEIELREQEEGHAEGHLRSLTRLNIQVLRRLSTQLSDEARDRLELRTYGGPLRFNITIVDEWLCIAQPYLPFARGVESPTFVTDRRISETGLFETFQQTYTALWEAGRRT